MSKSALESLRRELRSEYIALNRLHSTLGATCGCSLLGEVSGSFRSQCIKVADLLEAMRNQDPTCPQTPSWILSGAGVNP